jgi:LmbE family N-acetylglucosaminyl deacetylase
MEYGASAAVHAWARAGVEVTYFLLTSGEAGMADAPDVIGPLRRAEQRDACDTVGVTDLRFGSQQDGVIEYSLVMRAEIAAVIREVRPDLVVTANFEVEAYGGLNQADHRATGLAVIDAVRDAANPWVFRDQIEQQGLEPFQARGLAVAGDERPTHAKAVEEPDVHAAVASLRCHRAYLEHVTNHPVPEEFIPEALRSGGRAAGSEYAVLLRVFDLGGLG